MTSAWSLFVRLILRPLMREPIRAALTMFAVALGVGVVIAIDVAGQAAAGSFHSSLESLTGKSDLLITSTGGLDEKLLGKLARLPYAFELTPRIEDFASINGKGEAIPFIGLDLVGADPLFAPSSIWVTRRLGFKPGDHVRLLINDVLRDFLVAKVIDSTTDVILADIGLAQVVTGKLGKLDSIDVRDPSHETLEHWQAILREQLPPSASVEPQGARTDENRKMLSAFRWNLRVLSYIALVVGAFLIYNTISISVVRRRNEIGVLRALGASRAFILNIFLAEASFFAVTGSALGLILGRFMAIGAVKLIGTTVNSLYVSSQPGAVELTLEATLLGVGLGLAVSLLAALAPAMDAALVAPVEAMARGRGEYVAAQRSHRTIWWAVAALILAAFLSTLPAVHRQPFFAYLAVLLLLAGTAAAIPNIVELFAALTSRFVQRFFPVEALLAMRSLRASLGRTAVLTAALTKVLSSERDAEGRTHYDLIKQYYKTHEFQDYDVNQYFDRDPDSMTDLFYKGDRSMRESGFDPSNRFGPFNIDIIHYDPVCLNSLLYLMETQTAQIMDLLGRQADAGPWRKKAADRAAAMNRLMWDDLNGRYSDYDFATKKVRNYPFLTTFYPLWAGIASKEQAARLVKLLPLFERDGGLQTSTQVSGNQWDAPFGWAPLELITCEGLRKYGYNEDADRISMKWLSLVRDEYRSHGYIVEKYDVVHGGKDVSSQIKFGYRTNEAGFGWTNTSFTLLYDALPPAKRKQILTVSSSADAEPIRKTRAAVAH